MEVWLDLLRRMTPGEKLAATFRLTDLALRAMDAEVRAKYPDATGREVKMRVASRHLSRELMIAAYDWDPLANGELVTEDLPTYSVRLDLDYVYRWAEQCGVANLLQGKVE